MTNILIFANGHADASKLSDMLGAPHVMTGEMSMAERGSIIEWFHDQHTSGDALLKPAILISTRVGVSGWRAPKGTTILFTASAAQDWPKDYIIQAQGRVAI